MFDYGMMIMFKECFSWLGCKEIWLPVYILDEDEEDTEQESDDSHDGRDKTVFKVTCGAIAGMLHRERFASGLLREWMNDSS